MILHLKENEMENMFDKISGVDFAIIVVYLLGIVGVGCYAGLRNRREGGANRYFLASHSLRWPTIGLALFTTNISCLHLISLAQSGYDTGLVMGNYEWLAAFPLILLALVFVPFYMRTKVATLPDFLERRYCRACRDWLAILSIIAAILFHIAFPLSAGWIALHGIFGIDKWQCIFIICGLTAVYTVSGGLAAVVWTESIQAIVLIAGAILITVFAYQHAGGWESMTHSLEQTKQLGQLSMLRSAAVDKDFSWYAILLGYPVIGIWYFCADQTIVQRVLGAKDENHARIGPLFCAVIKILPVFIFVLPGLLFYVIVGTGKIENMAQIAVTAQTPSEENKTPEVEKTVIVRGDNSVSGPQEFRLRKGDVLDLSKSFKASPERPVKVICNLPTKLDENGRVPAEGMVKLPENVVPVTSKESYGLMIQSLLPRNGCFGIMAAALMASLMGNLASAANSISTLFAYDLWKRFRPDTPERRMVILGRLAAFASFAVGIALVPLLDLYENIFASIQLVISHVCPPITGVFLVGIFWGKASARSAKLTMWIGSAAGVALFAITTFHKWQPDLGLWNSVPNFLYDTPFMIMAFYMLVGCVLLQVILSFVLPKRSDEDPQRLYWANPLDALKSAGWPGLGDYRVIAALVLVAMIILYWLFR
jgi:SSS family transporter